MSLDLRQDAQVYAAQVVIAALHWEQFTTGNAANLAARMLAAGPDWIEPLATRLRWMVVAQGSDGAEFLLDGEARRSAQIEGQSLAQLLRPVLVLVWARAESQVEDTLGPDAWRLLFDAIGYTTARRAPDGDRLLPAVVAERPAAPVTLYRGALPEYALRWSWTSDLEAARVFATHDGRFRGYVWSAQVEPGRLLGFAHWDVPEYVVDTRGLVAAPLDTPPDQVAPGTVVAIESLLPDAPTATRSSVASSKHPAKMQSPARHAAEMALRAMLPPQVRRLLG